MEGGRGKPRKHSENRTKTQGKRGNPASSENFANRSNKCKEKKRLKMYVVVMQKKGDNNDECRL